MADPEARILITGRDATAAAFQSADKNLKQFQRTAQSVKGLLASFGVVFSARAFAGWIAGSLQAKNMTEEQLKATKGARDAIESMKAASDELARSLANSLVPAMEAVSAVLTGWNRIFFGADPFPLEEQIRSTEAAIASLERRLVRSRHVPEQFTAPMVEQLIAAREELQKLRTEQERLLGVGRGGSGGAAASIQQQFQFHRLRAEGLKIPNIELDELRAPDGLEPISVTVKPLDIDELAKSFPSQAEINALFKPFETESERSALEIGSNFKHAFADWLVDGQFKFKEFLKRLAAEWLTSEIFRGLSDMNTKQEGKSPSILGSLLGIFAGARANGGPVSAGKSYLVGERGPELFTPRASGAIVPGGGATVINQHFHNQVGLPPQWDAQMSFAARMAAQAAYDAVMGRLGGRR